ncbi:hypothetical protein CCM_03098 [Cordyceps militaris CM01]|uniref:Uncharacterized protein n=1 Tax=Cordyceps militaris (strain CM01) TaxID=983644 RepID=G3J8U4_CORMM|nr:uncharacterized protein CCM_03098 [Cordyceps militaris CM01]EGX94827.1 hypothetical protein CCM_03098 [Cordyceps militaris CM01]
MRGRGHPKMNACQGAFHAGDMFMPWFLFDMHTPLPGRICSKRATETYCFGQTDTTHGQPWFILNTFPPDLVSALPSKKNSTNRDNQTFPTS